jgi:HPt (histidine-containing phosphotransfer) domain-containing protein
MAPAAPAAAVPTPVDPVVADEAPDFDPAVLASLPMVADGSDPGFADHLLAMFARSAQTSIDAVAQGVAGGDRATLLRGVHSLKSAAAQLGALALAGEAARQELALRQGEAPAADWPERLRRCLARFGAACARQRGALPA